MAGQLWATNSLGGFFYSLNLSKELRYALEPLSRFRQFADVKNAAGKNKGQTFTWDVVSTVTTQGRTLVETNTMPQSNFTITQGTLTINEAGNSVPYSGMLEAMSQFDVKQPVMNALKNDAKKTFDILAHAQFQRTPLRVVGTHSSSAVVLTTNSIAAATNTAAYTNAHAKGIVDIMKERNIPPYQADDYYAIAWPTTLRTFKNNLESIFQYTTEGFNRIMNGEIGRYENTRYVEQTHIPKGGAADATLWDPYTHTAEAWDNALSDWIFFIGEDTVAEGMAVPEEIRAMIPQDYGRSKGVAWYWLGGYGIVHTGVSEARIVKWDSAS